MSWLNRPHRVLPEGRPKSAGVTREWWRIRDFDQICRLIRYLGWGIFCKLTRFLLKLGGRWSPSSEPSGEEGQEEADWVWSRRASLSEAKLLNNEISKTRGPSGTRTVFLVTRTHVPTACEQLGRTALSLLLHLAWWATGHFRRSSGQGVCKHSKWPPTVPGVRAGHRGLPGKAEVTWIDSAFTWLHKSVRFRFDHQNQYQL